MALHNKTILNKFMLCPVPIAYMEHLALQMTQNLNKQSLLNGAKGKHGEQEPTAMAVISDNFTTMRKEK